jgi:non-specific protein-tyrosine kinase
LVALRASCIIDKHAGGGSIPARDPGEEEAFELEIRRSLSSMPQLANSAGSPPDSGAPVKRSLELARAWLWLLILVPCVVAFVVYLGIAHLVTPIYRSTATLQVDVGQVGNDPVGLSISEAQQYAQTEAQLIVIPPVANLADSLLRKKGDLSPYGISGNGPVRVVHDPSTLLRSSSASNPPSSQLIFVSAASSNPVFAQQMAQAMAWAASQLEQRHQQDRFKASIDYINGQIYSNQKLVQRIQSRLSAHKIGSSSASADILGLTKTISNWQQSLLNLKISESRGATTLDVRVPAQVTASPVSPTPLRDAALAGFLAFLLTLGAVYSREYFRSTLETSEEISRALGGVPVIGAVMRLHSGDPGQTVATQPRSPTAEAYRVIRTNLLFSNPDHPPKAVLITSARQGEGKTTTALNLAAALAELGGKVLIIDADLRRPSLHRYFDIDNRSGLTSAMLAGETTSTASWFRQTGRTNLFVLPSGPLPPNPAELLSTQRMAMLVDALRAEFDYMIIDSPPILPVADPIVLSRVADAVILVADVDQATRQSLSRAGEALTRVGSSITGVILNKLSSDRRTGSYYYYSEGSEYTYGVDHDGQNRSGGRRSSSSDREATREPSESFNG